MSQAKNQYFYSNYSSPVGELTISATADALVGLWIKDQKYFGAGIYESHHKTSENSIITRTENWLDSYFSGLAPSPYELPLAPIGSDFRQLVWKQLLQIPYGKTTTYGHIASLIATSLGKSRMSAQAIGGAVGHNPIAIIIPCHRVIGSDGSLTGYAGGLHIKEHLLRLEGYLV